MGHIQSVDATAEDDFICRHYPRAIQQQQVYTFLCQLASKEWNISPEQRVLLVRLKLAPYRICRPLYEVKVTSRAVVV